MAGWSHAISQCKSVCGEDACVCARLCSGCAWAGGSVWTCAGGVRAVAPHVCTCMQSVCAGKSLKLPPSENLMSWVKQPNPGCWLEPKDQLC